MILWYHAQASLAKDTAVWQRGLLALPRVVPVFLQFMFVLLDRLAALAQTLKPAAVTGAFTGQAYHSLFKPVSYHALHNKYNCEYSMITHFDRLAALAQTIKPAAVTGAFTGQAYHRLFKPVRFQSFKETFKSLICKHAV